MSSRVTERRQQRNEFPFRNNLREKEFKKSFSLPENNCLKALP